MSFMADTYVAMVRWERLSERSGAEQRRARDLWLMTRTVIRYEVLIRHHPLRKGLGSNRLVFSLVVAGGGPART
jgi:hypothetical protein